MKLLNVDTLEAARQKILGFASLWKFPHEELTLNQVLSFGFARPKILAEDLYSPDDIPGFARSTVDGYALLASDSAGAGEAIPVFLKLAGTVAMGKPVDFSIQSGECAYVPTGGMLPAGADAVVMVEHCENAAENIAVYEAAAAGAGTALAGEDVRKGGLLLRRGALIRPQEAGALAAAGVNSVPVFAPLALSLISTGDELIPSEQNPRPGEIRDINTTALKAQALKRGFRVLSSRLFGDDEKRLEAAMREALPESDILLVSGGSSQGEKDYTAGIFNRISKPGVFTHGLALKPGKPTILGWDEKSQTLLVGLPGHPVAAMMVFELLLGWLFDKLFDRPSLFAIPAKISCNLPASPGRAVCQPVILHLKEGSYTAEPVFGKSGMITTLTQADGYIIIDLNKEGLTKGEDVLVNLLG